MPILAFGNFEGNLCRHRGPKMGASKELDTETPLGGLGRSAVLPDELYPFLPAMGSASIKVLIGLLRHWNRKLDAAWPSVRTLARDTGYCERQVHRALKELQGLDPETGLLHGRHPALIVSKGAHRHLHTTIWSIPARARLAEDWHQMRLRLDADNSGTKDKEKQPDLPLMKRKKPDLGGDVGVKGGGDTHVTQTGNPIQTGFPPNPPSEPNTQTQEPSGAANREGGGVNLTSNPEPQPPVETASEETPAPSEFATLWAEVMERGQAHVRLKGALRAKLRALVDAHGLQATREALLGAAGDSWWSGRAPLAEYREQRPMSWRGVLVSLTKSEDLIEEMRTRYRAQETTKADEKRKVEQRQSLIQKLVDLEQAERTPIDLGSAKDFFARFNADRVSVVAEAKA